MYHHDGNGGGTNVASYVSGPSFSPGRRAQMDLESGVLGWAVYTGMNTEFAEFMKHHTVDLKSIEGVDFVWHQFRKSGRSIQVKQIVNSNEIDITFTNMPAILLFDSFTAPTEAYLFRIDESSRKSIVSDLYFLFDQVREHWVAPVLSKSNDENSVRNDIEALRNARLNFLYSIAPNHRFRKLKSFAGKNGLNVIGMIANAAKTFL
ncbi:hypothetical protein [Neorhizobium galegae]|uniref:hypothetical protein n=1 Tax=Neorhizobium galegae TaxID=399 RepID=UPI00126F32EB|nr:hypothetical protein [Neorhizobium galegae]KAA9386917.1 hypothetical protein F4V88_10765 [Neorhizobium galegae]MCM2499894.1 hypothetical protein [Neorhizobium galegae]